MKMKKAIVDFTIRMSVEVPEDSDESYVDFYLNESSHCTSNEIEQLHQEVEALPHGCNVCLRSNFKFVKWSDEDEEKVLHAEII